MIKGLTLEDNTHGAEILCIGELLWDALHLGLFLGGAPFNVACNLHELGWNVGIISRIGDDTLGREILRRLEWRGISSELIQVDKSLNTGFVEVSLDANNSPEYIIRHPAAWDNIHFTQELLERADHAKAIVFGSLAQRERISRATIEKLFEVDTLRVFDINLRPPYVDKRTITRSLEIAHIVKLNHHELKEMQDWYGLSVNENDAVSELGHKFNIETICVTKGKKGALVWKDGQVAIHNGYPINVIDAVGAGDGFIAGMLSGLLQNGNITDVVNSANLVGAYVAMKMGATPIFDFNEMEKMYNTKSIITNCENIT